METARKIAAIIVGVFILVLVVLAARWVGEQIRERFLTPKPIITTPAPVAPTAPSLITEQPGATISAIPSTGPMDFAYAIMGLTLVGGLLAKRLAHRLI